MGLTHASVEIFRHTSEFIEDTAIVADLFNMSLSGGCETLD